MQAALRRADPVGHACWPPVRVGQQHREVAASLQQVRHIGIATFTRKHQYVVFSTVEALPGRHLSRPARDPALLQDAVTSRLAVMPCCLTPPYMGQAQIKLLRAPFKVIHVAVDLLVAQPPERYHVCPACFVQSEPATGAFYKFQTLN